MLRFVVFASMLVAVVGLGAAQAPPGIKRTDLQREDISAPGREAIQVARRVRPRHFLP